MIEIVIKYDMVKKAYAIYEPTTDSLMVADNLTEALLMLNRFLLDSGMSKVDILSCPDISYHIDSQTMLSIIEGNMKLMKRLNTAPSGFQISTQRFGGSMTSNNKKDDGKKTQPRRSGNNFQGATGFRSSYKKFGGG